ncbi:MAG: ABC transporter permease [Bacteroidota bacterium]
MKNVSPPKWADRFLEWYCNPRLLEEIQGDTHELYARKLKETNRRIANIQFAWNVVRFFRWSNIRRPQSKSSPNFMMYSNYFAVFKRGFLKQKGYSFLNVLGLAIGIACFLLISLYMRNEYSFDRIHSKADRIYRIHEILQSNGVGERSASQPFPVANALVNDYAPRIEKAVRFFNYQAPTLAMSTLDNKKVFNESRVFCTDSTFFDVFDFPMIEGNPKTALSAPQTIVLTESMAKRYFEDQDPIGQYLRFQGTTNLLVTGVMRDVPLNTHFQFDCLISFRTLEPAVYDVSVPQRWHWHWNPCWTYLLLRDASDAPDLQAAMPAFVQKYFPEFLRNDVKMELFPLTDIHLKSNMDYEIQPNSSLTTMYVFGSISIFVLLIACINFINLSTARATKRAKEVGMRKTLGSQRTQLIFQFLFESILVSTLSVVVAIVVVLVVLPSFNLFAEINVERTVLLEPFYIGLLTSLALVVGVISGMYPAFVLSGFQPLTALKAAPRSTGGRLRQSLVVVQFALSIILLVGTGVAMDQLAMLQRSDTGFTRKNVILIPVSRSPVAQNYEALKNEFLRDKNTLSVTAVEEVLGAKHQVGDYLFEGQTDSHPYPRLVVRHDFTRTFEIPMVAGRDFSEDVKTDDSLALVVNETFVRQMGWPSKRSCCRQKVWSRFQSQDHWCCKRLQLYVPPSAYSSISD